MKGLALLYTLLFSALPVLPARPVQSSVQALEDLLISARQSQTRDSDLATKLSKLELSEELTASNATTIIGKLPGPLSTEQLYVLEIRSAILPPPASDLPDAAMPDESAQQAMLKRAETYVTGNFTQLPPLTAQHLVARFQDGMEAIPDPRRGQPGVSDPSIQNPGIRLINHHIDTVELNAGVERSTVFTETRLDGPNNVFASIDVPLSLTMVLPEAVASGTLKFVRWQTIQGQRLAVFSFAVEKKKTHFSLTYHGQFSEAKAVEDSGVVERLDDGTVFKTSVTGSLVWKEFKHAQDYRGEIFLQPDTGVVARCITEANFQPSGILRRQTVRTDFAAFSAGGGMLVAPIRSFSDTEFVDYRGAQAGKPAVRHTYVTEDFRDYKVGPVQLSPKM